MQVWKLLLAAKTGEMTPPEAHARIETEAAPHKDKPRKSHDFRGFCTFQNLMLYCVYLLNAQFFL